MTARANFGDESFGAGGADQGVSGGDPAPAGPGARVGAVDIGTNTLLCLIAEVSPRGDLVRVADHCRFGRLGRGLDRSGELGAEAVATSLDILREYREILRAEGAQRVTAAGTQALREAGNAASFLEPAEAVLGVPIEVIGGQREAELVFRAVASSLPAPAGRELIVADVGGGSTEIITGAPGGGRAACESLPIGAVRLTERHLRSDPPRADEARELTEAVSRALEGVGAPRPPHVVGTSGTATTLASVAMELGAYDPDTIHGRAIEAEEIERQLRRYLELPVAARRAIPGMQRERADVIAAGAAIYAGLLRQTGAREMVVSDRGVRWGLAHELAA